MANAAPHFPNQWQHSLRTKEAQYTLREHTQTSINDSYWLRLLCTLAVAISGRCIITPSGFTHQRAPILTFPLSSRCTTRQLCISITRKNTCLLIICSSNNQTERSIFQFCDVFFCIFGSVIVYLTGWSW